MICVYEADVAAYAAVVVASVGLSHNHTVGDRHDLCEGELVQQQGLENNRPASTTRVREGRESQREGTDKRGLARHRQLGVRLDCLLQHPPPPPPPLALDLTVGTRERGRNGRRDREEGGEQNLGIIEKKG